MTRWLLVVLLIAASCWGQDMEASGEQEDGGGGGGVRTSRKRPATATGSVNRLLNFYNRNELPNSNTATNVSFRLAVDDIYSLSTLTQDLSLSYQLEMMWTDPRLKLDQDFGDIRLGEGRWHNIWVPDAVLANEKRSSAHALTVANRLFTLKKNGQLTYKLRLSSSLACPMSSFKFPFDAPTCQILIKSVGHSPAAVAFTWAPAAISVAEGLSLPDYSLVDHSNNKCAQDSGAVSCLSVDLHFKRKWAPYFIKFYVPSLVMVLLSWTQVQLDSARASLLVTLFCVLGMLHLLVSAPCPGGLLDAWLVVCLILITLQLPVLPLTHSQETLASKEKGEDKRPLKLASKIAFPALFILFNVIYWCVVIAA